MRTGLSILLVLGVATALAERQPFARYQTIVDRQMFGEPPPGFDPAKMPSEVAKSSSKAEAELTQEQEKVKNAIRFSVINVTSSGETAVGFTDNGDPKNAVHYYLKVGESRNGWTVKEADPELATMTIEKEGVEVTLKLGGDSAKDADAVSRVNNGPERSSLMATGNLRERKRRREADQRAAEERRAAEEKARVEREARRDQMQSELLNELQKLKEESRQAREATQAESAANPAQASE